jgi:hypothetical protein
VGVDAGQVNTASATAIGGAAYERGSGHRAAIAAHAVTHGLRGEPLRSFGLTAPPVRVHLEADTPVDDLVVTAADGARAFVQAKATGDKGTS